MCPQASLNSTIVGMAQNFVGSNNINFLYPAGQFGTRIMGGKDAASARYIFTRLEEITRSLFHIHDDPLLAYLEEDGQRIEPEYYVPIIPTVLVRSTPKVGALHPLHTPFRRRTSPLILITHPLSSPPHLPRTCRLVVHFCAATRTHKLKQRALLLPIR